MFAAAEIVIAYLYITPHSFNHLLRLLQYNLGERYTDLTKVLFVIFYYSALYPAAFFFGTAILIVQHFVSDNIYAYPFVLTQLTVNFVLPLLALG